MVNRQRLIKLTRKLISINSQNPPGDEYNIAWFVKNYLCRLGLQTKTYEFSRKRANVVGTLKGRNNKKSLLLTPHLDTVPAGKSWRHDPLRGCIKAGRIYGLGATDCKGNLAVAMEAVNSIVEEGKVLDYNLVLAATADEECGSYLGLAPLLNKNIIKPDAAVVLDLDDFGIMVAQKGLLHIKIKIEGKRAHGAYPWLGVNAIDTAIKIIQNIKNYKFGTKTNKYLRPPTVNIGTINGGDKVNVVADWCEFELDIRSLPGISQKKIIGIIKSIVKKYAVKFKVEIEGIQRPYLIREAHPLVACLKKAMDYSGITPRVVGCEGATVVTFFQDKRIPAVATGFGVAGCDHIADEYVTINNLYKGAQVIQRFLQDYKFK